jgi:hypothetical protein
MTDPENDTHESDANTDEQAEAAEDPKDLEPEQDVKGGAGWPNPVRN